MYRVLLFDLDGTLTDPHEGITRSVAYALEHWGMHINPDDLLSFIGPPLVEEFMRYANFDLETAREAVVYFRERFTDVGIFENRVIDGVPEMLGRLHDAEFTLCVASSKPEPFVRRILDKFSLTEYFTYIVGSTLNETRTAKCDVIREVFARMEEMPPLDTVLMIGDRIHDIDGASQCGIDAIGVRTGFAPEGELEHSLAKAVLSAPHEVADWILAQN